MTRFRFIAFVLWFALGFPAIAAAADSPVGTTLTVFAAASLREAFTAIGQRFESANHVVVRFSFAGADMLANPVPSGKERARRGSTGIRA